MDRHRRTESKFPRPELARRPLPPVDTAAPRPRKRTVAAAVIAAAVAAVAVIEPSAPADALGAVLTWAAGLVGL